ncbi:MAG: hypothetical protein N2606_02455 [Candidatus Omnitrophica bacterium]|nr:hypothetical protein [Candidatus Omnitrophota bacterium]
MERRKKVTNKITKTKKMKKSKVNKKIIQLKKSPKNANAKKTVKKKVSSSKLIQKNTVTSRKTSTLKSTEPGFLGEITHYFPKVSAAVITLRDTLSIGDTIHIKGHTTDFTQVVTSMQINHVPITTAKKGDEIGLQVNARVRRGDSVIKL